MSWNGKTPIKGIAGIAILKLGLGFFSWGRSLKIHTEIEREYLVYTR
jgi:hypothetical protein